VSRQPTRLHLGERHTTLARGADAGVTLDIGPQRVAEEFFGHELPTPQELERAIDVVEDEVMRARSMHANGGELITTDATLRLFAIAEANVPTLTIDAVERLFQRLASASLGDPSAMRGLPAGREAAAALLILRELMHHLGFGAVTWIDEPG
jgi:exopolyphosphatase/pppGpp-phosphohydrolase